MTAEAFIAKWSKVELTERSAAQAHFLDLCELVGHPKPQDADPKGEWFTFERGASKQSGGDGWADVWKKDFFGWEYKGRHKDLDAAYDQLLEYRADLNNPPLLVVCDMDIIRIRTNFNHAHSDVPDQPGNNRPAAQHRNPRRGLLRSGQAPARRHQRGHHREGQRPVR
jgi:hypothetical protein